MERNETMFQVGEAVIHPGHGPGKVVNVENLSLSDKDKRYYRIELLTKEAETTVWVPVQDAEEQGVRRPVSRSRLSEVWHVLRDKPGDLPSDHKKRYECMREKIENGTGTHLGVMIIDSHGRAWRNGTVGVTIGITGVPGVIDKRGETDLFGYELRATEIGTADELAAAASLTMGQVAEGTPIVHVRGFPYPLREARLDELLRAKESDLFR